ncbi:aminoglycoside 6'-N-acetyltransferase [Paenibacillus sp. NEAU-GSW1]|uniref:aminoglycoside 6'-N-acetyltransferase n=1 Tax=Paenibacillus sp. NEAU-GSW1 TaxID=2682486 RepID=UPI0012E2D396|nr:aminoglycoside 6'-N-acetyltransferase [Paenibacillus sp. NEAU-GSW1]MUT65173.1 GNAT family N-acetyltransferase [Paenibacillus sp. NEAU-GSW1]
METINEASEQTLDPLTEMALDLWPDNEFNELREDFRQLLQDERNKVFLFCVDEVPVGFVHFSIRTDYVEGSNGGPVGYVEGIYIKSEHRRKGYSKQLITQGEQWAKTMGCSQIASDIEISNMESYHFHIGSGFKEANRVICFIKDVNELKPN